MAKDAEIEERAQTVQKTEQVLMAYLEGRYVPTPLLLARLVIRYLRNKEAWDAVFRSLPRLLQHLRQLREKDPYLYNKLVQFAVADAAREMPRQVRAEDAAFLTGRLVRNLGEAVDDGGAQVVLSVASTMAIVFVADFPLLWLRAVSAAAQKHLEEGGLDLKLPAQYLLKEIAGGGKAMYPDLKRVLSVLREREGG